MAKKGKTKNGQKANARANRKNRTHEGKRGGKKSAPNLGGEFTKKERANFNRGLPAAKKTAPRAAAPPSRSASFRVRPKRTFQRSDTEALERVEFRAGKGRKLNSSTDTARAAIEAGYRRAKKKFSRKKSLGDDARPHVTVKIKLRWKSKKGTKANGKWVTRTLRQTSADFESAIEALLEHDEINSLTYERNDEDHKGEIENVASKSKKIVGVVFEKSVQRKYKPGKKSGKVSKAASAKKGSKKARHVRHRK